MSIHRPVIAYHLIMTAYGFWLPNDPRGSGSSDVWSDTLKPFGRATKVTSQRSVAHVAHDAKLRRAAKSALQRPPMRFDGHQARLIAIGFGDYLTRYSIRCLACAILPDHAHLVLERSDALIERIAIGLKAAAVHKLLEAGRHPYQSAGPSVRPKIWARGTRHPFLFDDAGLRRAIDYVEQNPVRAGLRAQRWSFVQSVEPRTK